MEKSKHTPGPWYVGGPHPGLSVVFEADAGTNEEPPRMEPIATLWGYRDGESHPEVKANARLIASAPELLKMLKMYNDLIPDVKAIGLIAKAEGRTK